MDYRHKMCWQFNKIVKNVPLLSSERYFDSPRHNLVFTLARANHTVKYPIWLCWDNTALSQCYTQDMNVGKLKLLGFSDNHIMIFSFPRSGSFRFIPSTWLKKDQESQNSMNAEHHFTGCTTCWEHRHAGQTRFLVLIFVKACLTFWGTKCKSNLHFLNWVICWLNILKTF